MSEVPCSIHGCCGRCRCQCVLRIPGGGRCFRSESTIRTMQEALEEAERYEDRCESLAALLTEARRRQQQAHSEEAERRWAAAEAAAAEAEAAKAAEAAAAVERMQLEARQAELALEMQQVQARLGIVAPAAPAAQPGAEEALCLVCMDAPKRFAMVPCLHVCACEACAQQLLNVTRSCPVCRVPIQSVGQVFF